MMMSFSSFELEKLDLIRDTERQKERDSRIRENANAFYLPSSFDQGRNKGNTPDGKEAERAGRFVFSDEYPHTHTHTHTHTHIKREKKRKLFI